MNALDLLKTISCHPGICLFAKNHRGHYLYCNERMAEVAGLDSPNEIVNKRDSSLVWREQAEIYRNGDQLVLDGGEFSLRPEKQNQVLGEVKVITTKLRLLSATGTPVGIAGCYWEVSKERYLARYTAWTKGRKRLVIKCDGSTIEITRREAMVLYLIVLGYSVRIIGGILNISENTASFYFKQLKRKFNVVSKTELIKICFFNGIGEGLHEEFACQNELSSFM